MLKSSDRYDRQRERERIAAATAEFDRSIIATGLVNKDKKQSIDSGPSSWIFSLSLLISFSLFLVRNAGSGMFGSHESTGSRRTSANNPLSLTAPLPGDRICSLERVGGIRELLYPISPLSPSPRYSRWIDSPRRRHDSTTPRDRRLSSPGDSKNSLLPLTFREIDRVDASA